jgi:hypothetical protein
MKTMVRCRRWVRPRERTIKPSSVNKVVGGGGESAGVRCKVCGMVLPMDTDEVEAHLENGCGGGGGGGGANSSISSNNVNNENRLSRNPFQSGFNRLMGSFREKNNQVDHGGADNSGAVAAAASVIGSDNKETAKLQKQVQVNAEVAAEKREDVVSMDIASLLLAEHAKAEKLLEEMALQRNRDNDDDDDVER